MNYNGKHVVTLKEFKGISGYKSHNAVMAYCVRNGISPIKLTGDKARTFCRDNGLQYHAFGILLFDDDAIRKTLGEQGIDTSVTVFNNSEFGELRSLTDDNGEPWFVGKDVAGALGYDDPSATVRDNVDSDDKALLKKQDGHGVVIENGSKMGNSPILENQWESTESKGLETIPLENPKSRDSRPLENRWKSPIDITDLNVPPRGLTIINESGLYSLILSSKLQSAKRFKHWVTSEVLPSIRKHGSYSLPNGNNTDILSDIRQQVNDIKSCLTEIQQQTSGIKAYLKVRDELASLLSKNI